MLTVEWLTPQSANRNKIESHHKPNNSETIIKEDDISAKQKNIFPLAQEEYRPSVTTDKMFPCFSSAPDMSNVSKLCVLKFFEAMHVKLIYFNKKDFVFMCRVQPRSCVYVTKVTINSVMHRLMLFLYIQMYLQFMPATKLHTSFQQSLFSIRRNEYDRNVLSVNQVGLHTH